MDLNQRSRVACFDVEPMAAEAANERIRRRTRAAEPPSSGERPCQGHFGQIEP
jgi:hypothetical protein